MTGSLDKGMFVFEGKPLENVSIEAAEAAVWEELERLKTDLIPADELTKVKNKVESTMIFSEMALLDKCAFREVQTLHTKGILTEHALIIGSMNLTESGINLLDEQITIEYGARSIADAAMTLRAGSALVHPRTASLQPYSCRLLLPRFRAGPMAANIR